MTAVLSGCGQRRAAPEPRTAPPPVVQLDLAQVPADEAVSSLAAALPPLSSLGALASAHRRVSDTQAQISGDAAVASGGASNHSDPGSGLLAIIPGGDDELAWAVYTLPDCDLERPVQLSVEAQAIIPGGDDELTYWLLVADFSRMRWQPEQGPNPDGSFSEPASVVLNSPQRRSRVVSAKDLFNPVFAYAVVTLGNPDNSTSKAWDAQPRIEITTSSTTLRDVSDPAYLPTIPHYTPINSAKSGSDLTPDQHLTITWDIVGDAVNNFANQAQSYEVWRLRTNGVLPQRIGSVAAGATSYTDPLDNFPTAQDPVPGTGYTYYLRAVNSAGYSIAHARRIHSGGFGVSVAAVYGGNLSSSMSIASLNGGSAIAYRVDQNDSLHLAIERQLGSGQWADVAVHSQVAIGYSLSLAVINGKPAISHYNNAASIANLNYSYCATNDGLGTWTTLVVDDGGIGSSLAQINGKPAIAYRSNSATGLRYAWSSADDGSSGWNQLTVDASSSVPSISLALVAGRPAISYYDQSFGARALKYATSNMADGSSGWTSIIVDNSSAVIGAHCSLAVINGFPCISYADESNAQLKFAWSSTATGQDPADWNTLVVEDNLEIFRTSLAEIGGLPVIAYQKSDFPGGLKLARSNVPNGSGGWTTQLLDASSGAGVGATLAEVGGRAVICHAAVSPDNELLKEVRRVLLD